MSENLPKSPVEHRKVKLQHFLLVLLFFLQSPVGGRSPSEAGVLREPPETPGQGLMSQAAFQGWAGGSCTARTLPSQDTAQPVLPVLPSLSQGQCPKGWALHTCPCGSSLDWTPAAISLPTRHPVAEHFGDIFHPRSSCRSCPAQSCSVWCCLKRLPLFMQCPPQTPLSSSSQQRLCQL